MSSVNFVRDCLNIPSRLKPRERKMFLEKLRKTDPKLFKHFDKFRGLDREDDFLLSRAVHQKVVIQSEAETIRELRTLRNFSSHFYPYSDMQEKFLNVLLKHGTDQKQIVGDFYKPAGEIAVILAHKLIDDWEDRIVRNA